MSQIEAESGYACEADGCQRAGIMRCEDGTRTCEEHFPRRPETAPPPRSGAAVIASRWPEGWTCPCCSSVDAAALDSAALDDVAAALDGRAWDTEAIMRAIEAVRASGRRVRDIDGEERDWDGELLGSGRPRSVDDAEPDPVDESDAAVRP